MFSFLLLFIFLGLTDLVLRQTPSVTVSVFTAFDVLCAVVDIWRRFEGTCCPSLKWVISCLILGAVFASKRPYLQDYKVSRRVRESSSPPIVCIFPLRMKECYTLIMQQNSLILMFWIERGDSKNSVLHECPNLIRY